MAVLVSKEKLIEVLVELGLENDAIIRDALEQVLRSQGSQKADDGSLQIEQHIFPVTLEVIGFLRNQNRLDPEIIATALLHDVLEDDRGIDEDSFRERFGSRVYNNVKLLTKLNWRNLPGESEADKKGLRDKIYFENLETAHEEVIIVKLADRLNNIARLGSSPEEGKKERYIQETIDHYLSLAEKHSKYFYDKIALELKKWGMPNKTRN